MLIEESHIDVATKAGGDMRKGIPRLSISLPLNSIRHLYLPSED
jgi:hypothetical protein